MHFSSVSFCENGINLQAKNEKNIQKPIDNSTSWDYNVITEYEKGLCGGKNESEL
jgi:hypothetical protein